MPSTVLGLLAAGALAAFPLAASAYEQLPRPLARLTPADFAGQIQIVDDPLEPAIVLSTRDGYARSRALKGARADDVHLRALVDRQTGRVTWQVWHDLIYVGGRKNVSAVHYRYAGERRAAEPVTVRHWLDQCPPTDGIGACNQVSRIVFELPEKTIREIAAAYGAGAREPWRLRFEDANGRDVTGGLAPAEAAGLVQALEAWRDTAA